MSYNTRRSGGGQYGGNRGSLSQNFVSGGQFQTTAKPIVQQQMQRQQQQQKSNYQPQNPLPPAPLKSALKTTNQQQPQQQSYAQQQQQSQQSALQQVHPKPAQQQVQQQQPQQQQQQQQHQQQQQQHQQQHPPQQQKQQLQHQQIQAQLKAEVESKMEISDTANSNQDGSEDGTTNGTKKKSFWRHIKAGKISKKEKRGRRNQRLRKILQPKNALMVLNELIGGQKYTIIEGTGATAAEHPENFAASVVVDGQEYLGYGKNKAAAKTSAAENALKNILINKLRSSIKANQSTASSVDNDADVTMTEDKGEEKPDDEDVSWLHVASYAIHKLFDSWDADGMLENTMILDWVQNGHNYHADAYKNPAAPKAVTKRPAKQLPANAELMNPVMLLNQMRPGILYEDFAKEGAPPAITFTIRCVCDGEEFFGKGNNKKVARKNCAFAACSKLFTITYPPDQVNLVPAM